MLVTVDLLLELFTKTQLQYMITSLANVIQTMNGSFLAELGKGIDLQKVLYNTALSAKYNVLLEFYHQLEDAWKAAPPG